MEGFMLGFFTTCLVLLEFRLVYGDRGRVYMVTSPESVVMPINDETILTCEMNLMPDRFQWRHYPLDINEASNPLVPIYLKTAESVDLPPEMFTIEKKTSTLKIRSSNKTVAGDYQCLAHYGASVVASVPGRITITTMEKFPAQESVQITVTSGNTVLWRCDPPQSNPPAIIDYYMNNNYIGPILSIPRTQSLIIPNINTTNTGIYKCIANNLIQQASKNPDFHFNLKVVNGGPLQAPKFIIPPKKFYTVNTGDNVFMECSAVGNPVPKVYWFKNNGELPSNRTELVPGGLRIFNVRSTDDGVYICNHTNSIGTISHHITLIYNEAPKIIDDPKNIDIKEGENLDLECVAQGTPEPQMSWILNGQNVMKDSFIEAVGNRIYFRPIEKKHAGILQCFASNVVGTVYSSSNLKVIPKQISSTDVLDDYLTPHPTPSTHKKRKHKNRHRGTTEMIPPSRPTVTRLNDESVMVRWSVPDNNGLPIQFFKVQYRDLGPAQQNGTHKGSKWRTTNADIPPHIRSYEVNNLNADHVYRFRIAAVYSNNDNKLGPNSIKFHLIQADFFLRNPLPVPRLVHAETVNETAVMIHWEYTPTSNISIDGFFVHYLPADSASDYMKTTVEGGDKRSYVIQHLLPGTIYDIKLQSFTTKSASEFSPIMNQSTAASTRKAATKEKETSTSSATSNPPPMESSGQTQLYIIIGSGILSVALLLSVIVLLIICKKRKQKKESATEDRGDKDDGSHHIQADANDYVVSPKSIARVNGSASSANRITITPNPLAEADNKNPNMIEMTCLSSQNNNCSQPSASTQPQHSQTNASAAKNKIDKHQSKRNINKQMRSGETAPGENYV